MICPACESEMVIIEFENVELDRCLSCQGTWFDRDELRQLFRGAAQEGEAVRLVAQLDTLSPLSKSKRRCPRCRGRLVEVEVPNATPKTVIDRCSRGDGLWFDAGEVGTLVKASLAHGADEALQRIQGHFRHVTHHGRPSPG